MDGLEPKMTELALIERALTPAVVFGAGGVDGVLNEIAARAKAEAHDVGTAKGRAAIASLAHKVARSKTALDDMGKALAAEWKQRSAAVDAERRRIRDFLDALKDEVRAPLTEWEAREQARKDAIEARVQAIRSLSIPPSHTSDALAARLEEIKAILIDDTFEDRAGDAALAKDAAMRAIDSALADARRRDAEEAARRAEQERLAEERRQQQEREVAERAERERVAAQERAEREAAEAAEREERARREEAERAKREAQAAAERAKREAEAAAERERKAKEDAERKAREAVEAERRRVAQEAAEREATEAKRAANQAHRRKVNREAMAAIVALGVSEDSGKSIVLAIVNGEVPHVSIRY
jgi:hypothetical protein